MVRQLRRLYRAAFEGTLKGASQALVGFTALWVYFAVVDNASWSAMRKEMGSEYWLASVMLWLLMFIAGMGIQRMCVDAVRQTESECLQNLVLDHDDNLKGNNSILSAYGRHAATGLSFMLRGKSNGNGAKKLLPRFLAGMTSSQFLLVLYFISSFVWQLKVVTEASRYVPWDIIIWFSAGIWVIACLVLAWNRSNTIDQGYRYLSSNIEYYILLKDHSMCIRLSVLACLASVLTWNFVSMPYSTALGWNGLGLVMLVGLVSTFIHTCLLIEISFRMLRISSRVNGSGARPLKMHDESLHVAHVTKCTALAVFSLIAIFQTFFEMQYLIVVSNILTPFCIFISCACLGFWCFKACYEYINLPVELPQ